MENIMDVLIFLTDRYPFGNSEAFIENEVQYLSERFDKIIVVPTALCVNNEIKKKVPSNFIVLPPANTDDIYMYGRPSAFRKFLWTVKNMLPWCMKVFFVKNFWYEMFFLVQKKHFSIAKVNSLIRTIAPTERNIYHFRNLIQKNVLKEDKIYVYSYWLSASLLTIHRMILHSKPIKIISRVHGYDLYETRRKSAYIPLKSRIIDLSDSVCTISLAGLKYLSKQFEDKKKKFSLSYLGTRDYGIEDYKSAREIRIVSCSVLIPVKRITKLIDCLSKIKDIELNWKHIGTGEDYVLTKKYADKILSNKDNIQYSFLGYMSNQEIMNYYKHNVIDLFINVSESEGLPVSIMEALSFGIPVIATNVGGTTEAVVDKITGRILTPNFTFEEFNMIMHYFSDMSEQEYLKYRESARKHWEKCFSAQKNYTQFINDNFK